MLVPSIFHLYGQGQTNMAASENKTEAEKEHQYKRHSECLKLACSKLLHQQLEEKKKNTHKDK